MGGIDELPSFENEQAPSLDLEKQERFRYTR